MAILDTSFLVAVERGNEDAIRLYSGMAAGNEPVRVPAAVWLEYLFPMSARQRAVAKRALRRASVFVPFDLPVAERAIQLQQERMRAGVRMGWHDIQVVATALHLGEPLVTLDRDFDDVPGLEVLQP